VSFEKRSANIFVERLRKVVIECLNSDAFSLTLSWRIVNSVDEQLGEPLQRVLVHCVDRCQIDNGEE